MTTETRCDLAVVGGGIAGLSAAAEAARRGLACTAFTGAVAGGLLLSIEHIEGLPDHPDGIAGYDLCPMTQDEAMDAGARFVPDEATALQREGDAWLLRSPAGELRARAVVLAPGSRLRRLGVPGEERLAGKGVSQCASCDAPLLRGKPVAVVGGGDAACQEALTLAANASAVSLLLRGDALRATPAWQARVRAHPRIALLPHATVRSIDGDTVVSGLTLADGRRLAVDAVFVFIGLEPATRWLAGAVPLDAQGRIEPDPSRGLFAAGSACRGHDGQAASAMAQGRAAAAAAAAYLSTLPTP